MNKEERLSIAYAQNGARVAEQYTDYVTEFFGDGWHGGDRYGN